MTTKTKEINVGKSLAVAFGIAAATTLVTNVAFAAAPSFNQAAGGSAGFISAVVGAKTFVGAMWANMFRA